MLRYKLMGAMALAAVTLTGCSGGLPFGGGASQPTPAQGGGQDAATLGPNRGETIWDAFKSGNGDQVVKVNKYIWAASLDVLSFLPVETVDPFTGVITTGFGTAPGSKTAYRATILIDDPALDARSLKLSLSTRSGPVDTATLRAVEDAILTRARQLRTEAARY